MSEASRATLSDYYRTITYRLSRGLGLDIPYFAKNGFFSTLQQVVGLLCGLAASYLFGHYLSKEIFGQYNLALSVVALLSILGLPGLNQALIQSVSRGFNGSLISATKLEIITSLVGTPLLLISAWFYAQRGMPQISLALILAAIVFPFLNTLTNYAYFLTGKRLFQYSALFSIFSSILYVLMHGAVIFLHPSVGGLMFAYLFVTIIPAAIGLWFCLRYISQPAKNDPHLFSYGFFLTGLSALPWITGYAGNIVLGTLLGAESLAIYVVASRFLNTLQKNFVVFYKPVTAKLAAQSTTEHFEALRRHTGKLLFIGCVLAAVLWFTIPYLITIVFGLSYKEAIPYGQLLSFSAIPLPLSWVIGDMLIFQKQKKLQTALAIYPQLVKILLYFIFIPRFKIYGLVLIVLIERFTDPLIPYIYFVLKKIPNTAKK